MESIDNAQNYAFFGGKYRAEAAALTALGSILFPNPDDPEEPHGPGAPVVHDMAVLLAMHRFASTIRDTELRSQLQKKFASALEAKATNLARL